MKNQDLLLEQIQSLNNTEQTIIMNDCLKYLTQQEKEIAQWIMGGYNAKEIHTYFKFGRRMIEKTIRKMKNCLQGDE